MASAVWNRIRLTLPVLCLALGACQDKTTGPADHSIRILEPLAVSWDGKQNGAPYHAGQRASFVASTELRVLWKFRIDGSLSGAVYKTEFNLQDHIQFTWDGIANFGDGQFMAGDHCTASITYDQLGTADLGNALVEFDIQ